MGKRSSRKRRRCPPSTRASARPRSRTSHSPRRRRRYHFPHASHLTPSSPHSSSSPSPPTAPPSFTSTRAAGNSAASGRQASGHHRCCSHCCGSAASDGAIGVNAAPNNPLVPSMVPRPCPRPTAHLRHRHRQRVSPGAPPHPRAQSMRRPLWRLRTSSPIPTQSARRRWMRRSKPGPRQARPSNPPPIHIARKSSREQRDSDAVECTVHETDDRSTKHDVLDRRISHPPPVDNPITLRRKHGQGQGAEAGAARYASVFCVFVGGEARASAAARLEET
ncbi:hypothetical protein B0H12DRAFT_429692 [Mycena haematopus]|nr:hypothetical protein B0H12DRAFT_429692 [Mycena haematopus]